MTELKITQADRQLLVEVLNPCSSTAESIQQGKSYTWEVGQIARHRIAAFADGFSAALSGVESILWRVEDDAFTYQSVSDAINAAIVEIQEMEAGFTGGKTVTHRIAAEEGIIAAIERMYDNSNGDSIDGLLVNNDFRAALARVKGEKA